MYRHQNLKQSLAIGWKKTFTKTLNSESSLWKERKRKRGIKIHSFFIDRWTFLFCLENLSELNFENIFQEKFYLKRYFRKKFSSRELKSIIESLKFVLQLLENIFFGFLFSYSQIINFGKKFWEKKNCKKISQKIFHENFIFLFFFAILFLFHFWQKVWKISSFQTDMKTERT